MGWILKFAAKLPTVIALVADAVDEARSDDGQVSPAEAEEIARDLSSLDDWLTVVVNGTDIVGANAQADLFAGFARIIARAEAARRR